MRRKESPHANRKHHLYSYAVQKPLIVARWTTTYSITDLHSNVKNREDCGKKFALLPPGLPLISVFMDFCFREPRDTSVLCNIMYPSRGDTKCLAAPPPITWSASYPSHLHILFAFGACTQQLPEVLKSYAFSPNVESYTVNWKKPTQTYIHYNGISEHGVGGASSCQAQETI